MTSAFGPQVRPTMTSANNVGPGWHQLIRDMEVDLNRLSPDYELMQVKEKFGGLRYYANFNTDENAREFLETIHAAEELSFEICEECGQPGEVKPFHGWLKTLCTECRAKQEEEYASRPANRADP